MTAGGVAGKEPLPAETLARRLGVAALPQVLAQVDSDDLDVRIRARALARRIVLDHYAAHAPEGMRFVVGRVKLGAGAATCDGLYLGVHEVTQGEFLEFARRDGLADRWLEAETGESQPRRGPFRSDLPVTNVSLEEARAFAAARGARLPTRDELSRAASGAGRLRYPWGDRFDPARVNSREAGLGRPEPVGSRKNGLSVHGVADLLGNVAEWTETPADARRFVVAGGSYRWHAERPAPPYKLEPAARLPDVGFRLAKSLPSLLTRAPE